MKRNHAILILLFFLPVFAMAQTKKTTMSAAKKTTTASSGNAIKASVTRGQALFALNCLVCHQVDGSGVPGLNPPLYENKWVTGPKYTLIQMVMKGSKGTVEIEGETFSNTMPVQSHLTDQQIADVLTYVRNSFGNKASAVTPAEVKAVRAKSK